MLPRRVYFLAAALLSITIGPAGHGAHAGGPVSPAAKPAPSGTLTSGQARVDLHGDPLPPGAVARLGTLRFRHPGYPAGVSYTPDGRSILTAGDGGACLFEASTGRLVRRFAREAGLNPSRAAVSPDGTLVAIGGLDSVAGAGVGVYELATGRIRFSVGEPNQGPNVGAFSPDGTILAVVELIRIKLYEVATGKLLHTLEGHRFADPLPIWGIAGLAFTRDGKTLVSAAGDGTIRCWDVARDKEGRRVTHAAGPVAHFALSPDGALVATVPYKYIPNDDGGGTYYAANDIRLWERATGRQLSRWSLPPAAGEGAPDHGPNFLAFTPDARGLVTNDPGGGLIVWDARTGKEARRLANPRGASAVTFSPDGRSLAALEGSAVRVYDFATGRELVPAGGNGGGVSQVALSPDGRLAATLAWGRLAVWDAVTGREIREPSRPGPGGSHVSAIAFSTADRTLLLSDSNGTVRRIEPITGRPLRQPRPVADDAAVALSPDGRAMAWPGPDGAIVVADTATGKEVRRLTSRPERANGLAFTGDGRALFCTGPKHELHVWNLETSRHRQVPCAVSEWVHLSAVSPEGRLVAFGGAGEEGVRFAFVDTATGKPVREFFAAYAGGRRHLAFTRMHFSPDGRTLAWPDPSDGTIRLIEVATGGERLRLAGHGSRADALAFSPDGRRLLTGGLDTTALVWDLTAPPDPAGTVTADDFAACWDALLAPDAKAAYAAQCRLLAAGDRAVAYLGEQLHRALPPDGPRVAQLLADLSSERFATRQEAARALEGMGDAVLPDLRSAAARKQPLEVRRRIEQLITRLEGWSGERLRTLRAVEALERIGSPEACRLLQRLAAGASGAGLTSEAQASLRRLAAGEAHASPAPGG